MLLLREPGQNGIRKPWPSHGGLKLIPWSIDRSSFCGAADHIFSIIESVCAMVLSITFSRSAGDGRDIPHGAVELTSHGNISDPARSKANEMCQRSMPPIAPGLHRNRDRNGHISTQLPFTFSSQTSSMEEVPLIPSRDGRVAESSIAIPDEITCPEVTKWKIRCVCCGMPIALVMPSDRLFLFHWEIQLGPPIFVLLLVFYCYFCFLLRTFFALPSTFLKITAFFEVTACLSIFLWSYFAAMCMDPGFLPYNWIATQRTLYSWEEQLDGLAIRPDQIEFAQSHKPPFASFSRQSGRFVIRADHICGWIANWVGKRNYKQFGLLIFWGLLLAASLFLWRFFTLRRAQLGGLSDMMALTIEGIFGVIFLVMGSSVLADLCQNQTQLERWGGAQAEGRQCSQGFREVCGRKPLWSWCVPTPAFGENPFA
jgi:hypothetical protein